MKVGRGGSTSLVSGSETLLKESVITTMDKVSKQTSTLGPSFASSAVSPVKKFTTTCLPNVTGLNSLMFKRVRPMTPEGLK